MMIPGYEVIQELSRTDWHVLHRGRRREDQRPVLLKTPRDSRAPAGGELLEREFKLLPELAIDGIPRALELLRHDGGCCLVLEDGGGVPLPSLLVSGRLGLDSFFKLAIRLSTILAELHRQEIVHQNINPRSILIHPATGAVWLADLSLAARSAGEAQAPLPPPLLRDTLAYLSPEQTGRMNRATDYRADFYALGVTFYELLTGARPFTSDDPLELIHWHIAKTPPAPSELDPQIPGPLSEVVMKLLAKTAEERYQNALGLKEDLELCAREWAARRTIAPFPLGQRDISDRFLISQKLYGARNQMRLFTPD
jgi:serine/threonine protein kinase